MASDTVGYRRAIAPRRRPDAARLGPRGAHPQGLSLRPLAISYRAPVLFAGSSISSAMPEPRAIFHLSFPVSSLDAALDFYCRYLGASIGRRSGEWTDVVLFGHQITLHQQPSQVLPRSARGVRHFGAILSWQQWEWLRARLLTLDPALTERIQHRAPGTMEEHVKLLLEDPDGNLIELKAYKDLRSISTALGEESFAS